MADTRISEEAFSQLDDKAKQEYIANNTNGKYVRFNDGGPRGQRGLLVDAVNSKYKIEATAQPTTQSTTQPDAISGANTAIAPSQADVQATQNPNNLPVPTGGGYVSNAQAGQTGQAEQAAKEEAVINPVATAAKKEKVAATGAATATSVVTPEQQKRVNLLEKAPSLAPKLDALADQPEAIDVLSKGDDAPVVNDESDGLTGKKSGGILNNANKFISAGQSVLGMLDAKNANDLNEEFGKTEVPKSAMLDPIQLKRIEDSASQAAIQKNAAMATKSIRKNSTSSQAANAQTANVAAQASAAIGQSNTATANANTGIANQEAAARATIAEKNAANLDSDAMNRYDHRNAYLSNKSAISAKQTDTLIGIGENAQRMNTEEMAIKAEALKYKGGSDVAVNTIGGDTQQFASQAAYDQMVQNAKTPAEKRNLERIAKRQGLTI